jgi:hypothetical protein
VGLRGPGPLALFDPATGRWSPAGAARVKLRLPGGGGQLVRLNR